jgi:hypothetical protein
MSASQADWTRVTDDQLVDWLFRYGITASIHGHFRPMSHESATYSRGYGGRRSVSAGVALRQRLQQHLSFLEIDRVKAFGEPAVDRRQQRTCFSPLTLLLPQAREAHGGP